MKSMRFQKLSTRKRNKREQLDERERWSMRGEGGGKREREREREGKRERTRERTIECIRKRGERQK